MTEEEYLRMKNILNTVIEQQAVFAENHAKADARMADVDSRMSRNARGHSGAPDNRPNSRAGDNEDQRTNEP